MTRSLVLAVLPALAAPSAWALTPDALWSAWQAQAASWGATLSAEAVPGEGGALTLSNWTVAMAGGPAEALPPGSPVQAVTLTPVGEGAVAIDLGLPGSVDIPATEPGGQDVRVDSQGLAITARDAPEGAPGAGRILYEVAAGSLRAVTLTPPDDVAGSDFAVEVAGLRVTFPGGADAEGLVEVAASVDGFAYVTDTQGLAPGMAGSQSSRSEGRMSLTVGATWPEGLEVTAVTDGAAVLRALDDGFALRVDYASEALRQAAWAEGFPLAYHYESESGPTQASLSLDRAGASLGGSFEGGAGTVAVPSLSVPSAEVSFGAGSTEVRVPFGPGSGEFRYAVALGDLVVGEAAWAALDPRGLLPRGPFGLRADVVGRATLDLGAALASEDAGKPPPVPSIEALEIRALALQAAGVVATASGAFAFDNGSGTPVPSGRAEARVEGLDRLIDAVVELGWITPEDARSARLGLAVAFRGGDGPDVRVMELEARPDGHVIVNGVQVQ